MCVCDIIRREVRVVGVVSEHQALLLITTTSTCVVPQSVVFVLLLRMGTRRCPSHHTHQSSCCPAHFPSNQLSLSPPLSESGRHPLSRVRGSADNWPDLDVHVDRENTRTRDITENLRHHSTVCVLLLVYGTPGVVHTTTTHHWTPQGGFTTNVIASPWNRHRFHRNNLRTK